MRKFVNDKCYICNKEATTREHAPPESFFPKGHRENLITVPSCEKHNTSNSKDVEYVRNIIVSPIQTNNLAREHFQKKVIGSYKRSRKLFDRTFKNSKTIIVNGRESRVVHIDLERFNLVMSAISYAIYFHDYNQRLYGGWEVFSTDLMFYDKTSNNLGDHWNELRSIISKTKFKESKVFQPEVFKYGVIKENQHKIIYEFVFYGGFKVYSVSIPFYMNYINQNKRLR